jgi:catechol 2,3-dioxygenase-like lactoylglutathione lyase family enzyme
VRQINYAVDHVGFTVPDLDSAVAFFCDAFGAEVALRAGPYDNVGYRWPDESEPESATLRLAILRLGDRNIELLEYADCASSPRDEAPRPSEQGAGHLALYVDDIHGAARELAGRGGCQVLGEVVTEQDGPLAGLAWVYVLTPFRLVIELIRWRPGMPYEQVAAVRLAGPPVFASEPESGRSP